MKKNYLGEILGTGGNPEVNEEKNHEPETVIVGVEEPKSHGISPETHPFVGGHTKRRERVRVEAPPEPSSGIPISDSVVYVQARRVAELKFGFYKWILLAVPVNLFFFSMAYFEIGPSGKFWFAWPLAVTGIILVFHYFRAFVLKGRNLQGMIEGVLHNMTVKESRKYSHHQDY